MIVPPRRGGYRRRTDDLRSGRCESADGLLDGRSGGEDVVEHDDAAGCSIPSEKTVGHVRPPTSEIEAALIGSLSPRTQQPFGGEPRTPGNEFGDAKTPATERRARGGYRNQDAATHPFDR